MKRLLVIWTARDIPVAQHHFEALTNTDKLWIHGHTEHEVAIALTQILIEHPEYEAVSFCADDGILSQQAYDQIHLTHQVNPDSAVSGWCNLDFTHTQAAIQTDSLSAALEYSPMEIADIAGKTEPFPITWTGMVCLTMTRELWLRFPLEPYGNQGGWATDHSTCTRLNQAGVQILCDPLAFLTHLKIDHDKVDSDYGWKKIDLSNKTIRLETA